MTALTGNPEAIPLPTVITSGTTSSSLQPNICPVRPKPVIISSAMTRAPYSCATSRTRARNPFGGTTLPALPWSGSIRIAAGRAPPGGETAGGDRLELGGEGRYVARVRVSEAGNRHTGVQIEKRAAVEVDERRPAPALDRQLRQERDRLQAGGDERLFLVKQR